MSNLKGLTFVAAPKRSSDPVRVRREKMITQLRQQKALFDDPNFVTTSQRWKKDESGSRHLVATQRRVKRWWHEDMLGHCVLALRYGAKMIEVEKGKAAIMVGDRSNLPSTIDAVIAAVAAGELDQAISATQKGGQKPKAKAA